MRNAALAELARLAEQDERVVFLTGDLGYGVVESFFERFPDRAFNVGVAEQNMVAMATGLAEAGLIPFVYSIAPFATLRPFEFIRNGAVLQQLPVRVLGVGAGMEYGINGPTHYALEDVGVLRTLPGITIVTPADPEQTMRSLSATWEQPGPVYYRLGKGNNPAVDRLDGRWDDTGVQVLSEGGDGTLVLALGGTAALLADVRRRCADRGIDVSTAVVSRPAPTPVDALRTLFESHDRVVTVEAHYLHGGLGSIACEVAAEWSPGTVVRRCAVRELPVHGVGSASYLANRYGIGPDAVVDAVMSMVHAS